MQLRDSSILSFSCVCDTVWGTSYDCFYHAYIMRMNEQGQILQQKHLHHGRSFTAGFLFSEQANGDIVGVGGSLYGRSYQQVYRLNSQLDTVWIKNYYNVKYDINRESAMIGGFAATPDGGFIGAGEFFSQSTPVFPNGIQCGWLLKIDGDGCAENCLVGTESPKKAGEISVFPNPFEDALFLSTRQSDAATATFYDVLGREIAILPIIDEQRVNTAELPDGVYALVLRNVQGDLLGTAKVLK
jgi:hypothetical protein